MGLLVRTEGGAKPEAIIEDLEVQKTMGGDPPGGNHTSTSTAQTRR